MFDAAGNYLPRAPKWTVNVGLNYGFDLGDGRLDFSTTAFFSGAFFWENLNRIREPGYEVINARAEWQPNSDLGLTLAAYVKNLTNNIRSQGANPTSTADSHGRALPRTYGVSAAYKS